MIEKCKARRINHRSPYSLHHGKPAILIAAVLALLPQYRCPRTGRKQNRKARLKSAPDAAVNRSLKLQRPIEAKNQPRPGNAWDDFGRCGKP